MIKVSVIVPIYNVEAYLRKCLESLANQTLTSLEVIMVDDGSVDGSTQIAKEYEKNYSHFHYYRKTNGGLSDARNYGMQYAKGAYLAFLDADDYVDVQMYQIMYEKAKKEDSDLVECNFIWEYETRQKKDIGELYQGKKQMLEKARVMAWNKLYKAEVLEKANILFPKGLQYEDLAFFYQLIPYLERVSFVKEPLVYYVQRGNSISNTQNEKTKDIFTVFDRVFAYYQKQRIYEEYQDVLEYTYARILLCSSLKRIAKIKDKEIRKELLNETWMQLHTRFPKWKQNRILHTQLNGKKRYMKTINRITFRWYAWLFQW